MQRPNNQHLDEWQKRNKKTNFKRKKPHRLLNFGETFMFVGLPMRENSQNKIHYGLHKGNKNFVTFATNNNN